MFHRLSPNDEQDEAECEEDEPEYNEPKVAYTIVNPGATFNYPQQSERVAAYGKAKPDFLESLKNLEGKKQPTVPGNAKQPEHEI